MSERLATFTTEVVVFKQDDFNAWESPRAFEEFAKSNSEWREAITGREGTTIKDIDWRYGYVTLWLECPCNCDDDDECGDEVHEFSEDLTLLTNGDRDYHYYASN